MEITKLDTEARNMLKYLNINSYMTYSTLATAFEDRYSKMRSTAELTLDYLASENLVKVTKFEGHVNMIQVLHLGRSYEERLKEQRHQEFRIMAISSVFAIIVSVITNMIIK